MQPLPPPPPSEPARRGSLAGVLAFAVFVLFAIGLLGALAAAVVDHEPEAAITEPEPEPEPEPQPEPQPEPAPGPEPEPEPEPIPDRSDVLAYRQAMADATGDASTLIFHVADTTGDYPATTLAEIAATTRQARRDLADIVADIEALNPPDGHDDSYRLILASFELLDESWGLLIDGVLTADVGLIDESTRLAGEATELMNAATAAIPEL